MLRHKENANLFFEYHLVVYEAEEFGDVNKNNKGNNGNGKNHTANGA